ncbi:MAG TPA: hypothetical protein DCL76_00610 [Chloroflexi bacterium]|nr:hypothetical protein [Chloroflexota bacterium]|tara:strand:- start:253 stop:774 length:522 start_codon:yes stop_codon:yes gene_type:complete
MKSFQQFITEVYDKDLSSATRQGGEGGRIRASRKKTAPEKRRVKAVGGGKTAPAKDYKDRKDIGTQRKRSEREQQPTRERGSAKLSPREQQKKARAERLAAKSGGKSKKELTKAADKLLSKKSAKKVDPNYKPQKASGYTRIERQKIARAAKRLTRDMRKGVNKPASHYDPKV